MESPLVQVQMYKYGEIIEGHGSYTCITTKFRTVFKEIPAQVCCILLLVVFHMLESALLPLYSKDNHIAL